jgi:hypothetical protein
MVSKDDNCDANGIPLKSTFDGMPMPIPVEFFTFTLVVMLMGQGIAWPIYWSNPKFDAKIAVLAVNGLGWVYVGLVLLFRSCNYGLGIILALARKESKVNVPDQQVYSVYTQPGQPKLGYVLMEKEGSLGRFNRAQRALQNYLEAAPFAVSLFLLAGFVFPFPAFCFGFFYTAARVVSAIGYTHSPGGGLAGSMLGTLALCAMEALVLIAGVKAIQQEA